MYAHNLRNSRPKRPPVQQPVHIKQESPPSNPSNPSIAHDLIDRLKQINNDSIKDTQLLQSPIPDINKEDNNTSQIISEKINEIRVRRSQSIDVLKKRIPPVIPEKSLTQREIPIRSLSSMQTPVTAIRRRMSRTEVSRTPQTIPPPIPPKPLKPYLARKRENLK